MREFLKRNALILGVLFFGYGAYALASTYVRPYGSSDYAGGQKAVGSKVNTEFESLTSWLNGGYIASGNIASLGVYTSNLANGAVTSAKLASFGMKVTDSSSAYSAFESVTPATVTNLSTTFTSTGRPLHISLEMVPATYRLAGVDVYGGFVQSGNNGAASYVFFVRDSSTTAFYELTPVALGGGVYDYRKWPCSAFSYTETGLTSGTTYTIALKASTRAASGDDVAYVYNCRLVVREEL